MKLRTTSKYSFDILNLNDTNLIPIAGTLLLPSTVTYILVTSSYEINYAQSVNLCDIVPWSKKILATSIYSQLPSLYFQLHDYQ